MDRRCFAILCHLLRTIAGLTSTKVVDVEEMVAKFLHILAYDVKNRVIQREFMGSGALDGTYIKVNVPVSDRASWEGSTADSRILRDALSRPNGLKAITTWLMSGTQMHRVSWHHTEANTTTCKNGVGRWAILQGNSYYPVEVQCRTILACCLLHNLINREMTNFDIEDNIDEVDSTHATTTADDIHYIETSNEWSQWRDDLAEEMFSDWELRNQ
ncbi:putative nuclease HARBI1 [Cucumis melo var. makuwa]|uniref:Putative nuclease HARBI1 n=1 Tax=Cucumis melo var. makuwa TaxID=1194695 RepID=A0A5D3BL48_CUCMM|nr:putative nuclease HARBI1 [Cucumis melo var. makuwa]